MAVQVNTVRFLIGDDDPNNELMTDQQVQNAIDNSTGGMFAAAALACRSLAARYARQVTTSSEQTRADLSKKSEAFAKLADWYEKKSDEEKAESAAPYFVPAGTDPNQAHEPIWDVGMHDNPNPKDDENDWYS
jgi:hypothetical protein